MLSVTILGNNSALSMHDRHQTAQIVRADDQLFLIDCGESTQNQMQRYKIKRSRINHIFISHLHGDHYFGLPGLLNTFNLTNRKDPLHIYATPELKTIIELQHQAANSDPGFPMHFHPLTVAGPVVELPGLTISCFPVYHRIPCWGFRFDKKGKPEKQREDGSIRPAIPDSSYAYSADTLYDERIIPFIKGADLLYHESTYLDDQAEKANLRFHSTSSQAASIALKSGVGKLLLGHFSSRYDDITPFETEARSIFPNAEVTKEGVTYLTQGSK